jgi:hypothetical protein
LAARSHSGGRVSGDGANAEALSLLRDAGLLKQSPTAAGVTETPVKAADGATEPVAVTREDLVMNTVAMPPGTDVGGNAANHTGAKNLEFSNANSVRDLMQALTEDVVSRPPGALSAVTAANHENDHPHPGSKAPRPGSDRIGLDEQSADPNRPIPANNIVNPLAAIAGIANSTTPNKAASGSTPRPVAPLGDMFSAMSHSGSGVVDASLTRATLPTPQSEIAFQAEIRLNNTQSASEAPRSSAQPDALAGQTVHIPRQDASANSAANLTQQPESKAPAESAETVQAIAFRRTGDHSDAAGSSHSQDPGGNLDRGTQQTAPLSQGSNVMASKPAAEGLPPSKTPATPAAAQLDSTAPAPPPDSGQTARSVALNIQSEEHGSANVVLTDRGGQVHVTVRSSDPALTHTLRSDLGSLAGNLQQQGFDVKLWNAPPRSVADAETRTHSADLSGQEDAGGQTRHRHSPDDAGHRNRRQGEWTEEFE